MFPRIILTSSLTLGFVLFLSGCATQSGFSKSFPNRLAETQTSWYYRHRGNPQVAPANLGASGGLINLQQLLDRLVYVSPLRGYPIKLAIVEDAKVNAHTDGSTIYLNTGLLSVFRGQDDLVASVMAHEIGHILASHRANGQKTTAGLNYLGYLTPALSALPYGSLYGNLAVTAVQQGAQMRQYSYSRLQENEADVIGVVIAMNAGYNGLGLSQFFDHIKTSGFGTPKNLSIPTSLGAIPQSAAITLLSSSPLYQTHPISKSRKHIVELVVQRKKGEITQEALRKESKWVADIYETLEQNSPKPSSI